MFRRPHRGHLLLRVILLGLLPALVGAHDMFLVAPAHHVPPGASLEVALHNGTFEKSENSIDRERMIDVSVVDASGTTTHPGAERWRDEAGTSLLSVETGPAGALLVGVSTRPRMIELSAADFDDYLQHDGVLDVLAERRHAGAAAGPVRERYSKHVKTLFRVGDASGPAWSAVLGYPAEIVPLTDPNGLAAGDTFEARVLVRGVAVPDQLVYASHAGFGGGEEQAEALQGRTDADGVVRLTLPSQGRWYARLIHMVAVEEEDADYESLWATLTFEVR